MTDIITIDPPQKIIFKLGKHATPYVVVTLTNNGDKKIAYKIKQNKDARTRYRIKPTNGIIQDTQEVKFQLSKQAYNDIISDHRRGKKHNAFRDKFKFKFLSLSEAFFEEIKKESGENSGENSSSRAAKSERIWKNDPNKGDTLTRGMGVDFDIAEAEDAPSSASPCSSPMFAIAASADNLNLGVDGPSIRFALACLQCGKTGKTEPSSDGHKVEGDGSKDHRGMAGKGGNSLQANDGAGEHETKITDTSTALLSNNLVVPNDGAGEHETKITDTSTALLSNDRAGEHETKITDTSTARSLSSNDLAVLGLQEVIRYFWFDVKNLALVSMLSVRTRESARNGRCWRMAVRAMFPQHPFEARDRKSVLFWFSRSARTVIEKDCRNDFRICLDRKHATELLQFAIYTESERTESNYFSEFFLRSERRSKREKKYDEALIKMQFLPIPGQVARAETSTGSKFSRKNQIKGFISELRFGSRQESAGIAWTGIARPCAVVVDLCRPYQYSTHRIFVYPDISCPPNRYLHYTENKTNSTEWCPRSPLEQSADGPDFVLISNTSNESRLLCVEGVAVQAAGPVAIRVELKNEASDQWVSVIGGGLLRPYDTYRKANANDKGSQQSRRKWIQLFIFPNPFPDFPLHSARVTVVECDGGGVRVGLLVSEIGKNCPPTNSPPKPVASPPVAPPGGLLPDAVALPVAGDSENLFCNRTDAFDTDDDYRKWWYRLQRARHHASRVTQIALETRSDIQQETVKLEQARKDIGVVPDYPWCEKRNIQIVVFVTSALVHGFLLIVVFPILLVLNLDQLTALHFAGTINVTNATTSHYNMASPNPGRIMRTLCWQHPADMGISLRVPWSAVFSPFAISMLLAFAMIAARFYDTLRHRRQLKSENAAVKKLVGHFGSEIEKLRARLDAAVSPDAIVDPGVLSTVRAIVEDYSSVNTFVTPFSNHSRIHYPKHAFLVSHAVEIYALINGLIAAVIYGVADWGCYFGDVDSQAVSVGVFCVLTALFVVMDVVAHVHFVQFVLLGIGTSYSDRMICKVACKVFNYVLFGGLIVQQLMLLLEMFTFFHETSFFITFLPILAVIVLLNFAMFTSPDGCCNGIMMLFASLALITGLVLLIFKTDELFGVGTALTFSLPEFTWAVVMIPVWVVLGIIAIVAFFFYFNNCQML